MVAADGFHSQRFGLDMLCFFHFFIFLLRHTLLQQRVFSRMDGLRLAGLTQVKVFAYRRGVAPQGLWDE